MSSCPLNCEKGYCNDDRGCQQCKCNSVLPCQCGVKSDVVAVLCKDGVTVSALTNVCARTASNECFWVRLECPIGISLTMKGNLSPADIQAIEDNVGLTNSADFNVTTTHNKDGTCTYVFWFQVDGMNHGTTSDNVNTIVSSQAKNSYPQAASYVINSNPVKANAANFAQNLLLPILCLIASMLIM